MYVTPPNTPGGSKRRAKLLGDLEAGARIADAVIKSEDVSTTPPSSDGEFTRLSSGEVNTWLIMR